MLVSLTLLSPSIPPCPDRHSPSDTFSRLSLILVRDWSPREVDRLLGEPEMQAPEEEFPRALRGGGDRFCLSRVVLAEIADQRLNSTLSPTLQGARSLVGEGAGALLRYGLGRWCTVMRSDVAEEGAEVTVASASSGDSCRRTVASVGLRWRQVCLVALALTPLQAFLSTHPAPSFIHGASSAHQELGRIAQPHTPVLVSRGSTTPVPIHARTAGSGATVSNQR